VHSEDENGDETGIVQRCDGVIRRIHKKFSTLYRRAALQARRCDCRRLCCSAKKGCSVAVA
jgi:hypothetical protein